MRYSVFFLLFLNNWLYTAVEVVKNSSAFEDMLSKSVTVALFYEIHKDDKTDQTPEYHDIQELYSIMQSLSSDNSFTQKNTKWALVNLNRPALKHYKNAYNFKKIPVVAILKNGILIRSKTIGEKDDRDTVKNFLLRELNKKQLRKNKKFSRPRKVIRPYAQPPYYFYRPSYFYNPNWYWDWPYGCYYGNACYGGPAVGFGFTIGI